MNVDKCYCMKNREDLGDDVQEDRCDALCLPEYFNATSRLCGGGSRYYSVYEKFDYVHQTAQGCYDPWRFIWYQSVIVETYTYGTDGQITGSDLKWYLHAASINSGEPLF